VQALKFAWTRRTARHSDAGELGRGLETARPRACARLLGNSKADGAGQRMIRTGAGVFTSVLITGEKRHRKGWWPAPSTTSARVQQTVCGLSRLAPPESLIEDELSARKKDLHRCHPVSSRPLRRSQRRDHFSRRDWGPGHCPCQAKLSGACCRSAAWNPGFKCGPAVDVRVICALAGT